MRNVFVNFIVYFKYNAPYLLGQKRREKKDVKLSKRNKNIACLRITNFIENERVISNFKRVSSQFYERESKLFKGKLKIKQKKLI